MTSAHRHRVHPPAVRAAFLCVLTTLGTAPPSLLAATGARSLSMEQIASAPFPSQLTAAPTGDLVAWIYNEQGARNVWLAERNGGNAKARRLTSYTGDDGNDIVDLVWNGDSRSLFYVRGGDSDGRTAVNPMSLASGPKAGEIWSVTIDGGPPKHIGDGTDPVPSPRGDLLVFVRDGQPFLARIAGSGHPHLYFAIEDVSARRRGRRTARVWPSSPRVPNIASSAFLTSPRTPSRGYPPASTTMASRSGRRMAGASHSGASCETRFPLTSMRTTTAYPGRYGLPTWRRVPAPGFGAPKRARAANSASYSTVPTAFSGAQAIVSYFRGKRPGGSGCIRYPPTRAANRRC